VLVLLCFLLTAAVKFQDQSDRVMVNIKDELGTVNPLLYGQNYGPWMDTSPEFLSVIPAGTDHFTALSGWRMG
jgi:hypothetical protein